MATRKLQREGRTAAEYIREVHCGHVGGITELESKAGLTKGHLSALLSKSSENTPSLRTAMALRRHVKLPLAAIWQFHTPIRDIVRQDANLYR